jgi:hypothetical protein
MKHLGDRIVLPRMALNMAGIYVNDKQVDLMLRILEKLETRKGLMNIKDVCNVEQEHLKEWYEYEQAERERQTKGKQKAL